MSVFHTRSWIAASAIAILLSVASVSPAVHLAEAAHAPQAMPGAATSQVWNTKGQPKGSAVPAKFLRYARRIIEKYDRNKNGVLAQNEWDAISTALAEDLGKLDHNPKGDITAEELAGYLASYAKLHPLESENTAWQRGPQPPSSIFHPATSANATTAKTSASEEQDADTQAADAGDADAQGAHERPNDAKTPDPDESTSEQKPSRKGKSKSARSSKKFFVPDSTLPSGLPDWFAERDADGDGQLTLGEFAPDGAQAQRQAFQQHDLNGDGVVTAEEVINAAKNSSDKKATTTSNEEPKK